MSLLSSAFRLHDLEDVERFCAGILQQSGPRLSHHEHEDALSWLIETAWELSLRYEPGDRPARFGFYAKSILVKRVHDWRRQRYGRTVWKFAGRTYERPRIELVSLDSDDAGGHQLVASLRTWSGDREADCDPELGGLLGARDRQEARDHATLGLRPPGRAA